MIATLTSQGGSVREDELPAHILSLSSAQLQAMKMQEYPNGWLHQLGGPSYSYEDLIRAAREREQGALPWQTAPTR